jgi:hypothetical protein
MRLFISPIGWGVVFLALVWRVVSALYNLATTYSIHIEIIIYKEFPTAS